MHRFSAIIRISLGLAALSASQLLVMHSLGVGPDEQGANLRGRREFCEALAIHSSVLLNGNELETLKKSLEVFVNRYPDVWAIDLRKEDGSLAMHLTNPRSIPAASSVVDSATMVSVPLLTKQGRWGAIEVSFRPLVPSGVAALWSDPTLKLIVLATLANGLVFFFFLKHNLQHLDPSRAVPERVRNALDTIPAGLVIVDREEHILLANKAFAAAVGKLPAELAGHGLPRFEWLDQAGTPLGQIRPWQRSIQNRETCSGATITLADTAGDLRNYAVRASPIIADDGSQHGALVSFDDVTELETKRIELTRALEVLRTSRDEVRKQNELLQHMATRDPLTDCLNRRSFYEALETHWRSAERYGHVLSFVMVDLDHFKSINDTHGHSTGDAVLQRAAETLRNCIRPSDLVCRFGGEEFCVLLPHTDLDQAVAAAERYRRAIEAIQLPEIKVTASLGVSSSNQVTSDARQMIDQADKCLYVAKRQGRNQVVRWDEIPHDTEIDPSKIPRTSDANSGKGDLALEIPYHAVTALISALAYRDSSTAEHSRRVAELCVITASGMMSVRERYILEIAATLHDIGKIGVPDAILLKPGPLTNEEWELMKDHDHFGVQIINSAFASPALTEIIRNHHAWYAGNSRQPGLPTGDDIPLSARILAIADAYDAIVSDRVYRKGRSQEEAFAELRRHSGTQFDGTIVERFITAVKARYEHRAPVESCLSRQTAVALGQYIECLAETLDKQDLRGLAALTERMTQTARQHGVPHLATITEQLQLAARNPSDLQEIVRLTIEAMDLCRSAQSAFLAGAGSRRRYHEQTTAV